VLKLIIVEDDTRLAASLKQALEQNPRYRVTAVTDDLAGTLAAARDERPDLALIDLQLANASSGFNVAARLHDLGVSCLFMTGSVPSFPLPDLAIGCLAKPFTESDLVRSLAEAEDILRGRERLVLRRTLPARLELYGRAAPCAAGDGWTLAVGGRSSWRSRIRRLIRRPSDFRSAVHL
jgi:two-component system, response regulator PdtaR